MNRFIFIVACGFTLTACASYMPNLGFLKSSSPEPLRIESEPPGAQATAGSQGPACQTPCEFALPPDTEILVTVSMNGYQPATVSVRPEGGTLQPNPVHVELQPAAPVKPAKKPSAKKKSKQAANAQ
jgi:hypothetical protein